MSYIIFDMLINAILSVTKILFLRKNCWTLYSVLNSGVLEDYSLGQRDSGNKRLRQRHGVRGCAELRMGSG